MIADASGWYAVINQDGQEHHLPVAVWHERKDHIGGHVLGLVSKVGGGNLVPAENLPGFVRYDKVE